MAMSVMGEEAGRGDRPLSGRTALVTGAARRVGAVIARALSRRGARLAIHHLRSASEASRLVAELEWGGGQARAFRADLSEPTEIARLFDDLEDASLLPDIVVNSAAIFEPSPLDRPDLEGWHRTLAINLTAPYLVSMHAARRLPRGSGDIVMIADVWGMRPLAGHVAYSTSKAGLIMLTRALARALAPTVRVNAIAPGPVLLPDGHDEADRKRAVSRTLLGREGRPEDVAQAVLFLVSATDYVTGTVLTIDGGRSVT